MGRGKREPAGHRGGDSRDRHGLRGSNDDRWDAGNMEEDPLRDLRPHDEDLDEHPPEEYLWPDLHDESEEDD